MATDLYEILGVTPEASTEEIKRAFRELARRLHPDATGGDAESNERYKLVSQAYSVLSDPAKRREYDAMRMGAGAAFPFGTSFEDIFDTLFGRGPSTRRTPTRARRGESIEVELELDLRDTVFGATRTLNFKRFEACGTCAGSGCAPGTQPERCSACGGTGQLQQVRRTILGQMVTAYPCAACGQTGWTVPHPCADCGGIGRLPADAEIEVTIPAGIGDGDRLRLSGQGEAGGARGPAGDLYVRLFVRPDERFARAGEDLVTWASVPMTTAALGGDISFESLDGPETISIPPGTQAGEEFRVRGRGFPRRNGRGRGDLLVRVHVATPTDLDAGQEELLRSLAAMRGENAAAEGGLMASLRRALRLD